MVYVSNIINIDIILKTNCAVLIFTINFSSWMFGLYLVESFTSWHVHVCTYVDKAYMSVNTDIHTHKKLYTYQILIHTQIIHVKLHKLLNITLCRQKNCRNVNKLCKHSNDKHKKIYNQSAIQSCYWKLSFWSVRRNINTSFQHTLLTACHSFVSGIATKQNYMPYFSYFSFWWSRKAGAAHQWLVLPRS